MWALTGVEGSYDPKSHRYQPPPPYKSWGAVVEAQKRTLSVESVLVFPSTSHGTSPHT